MALINALQLRILWSETGRPSPLIWSSTYQPLHPGRGPAGEWRAWVCGDEGQGFSLRASALSRRSQITSLPPEVTDLRLCCHTLFE